MKKLNVFINFIIMVVLMLYSLLEAGAVILITLKSEKTPDIIVYSTITIIGFNIVMLFILVVLKGMKER